jgi:hypothetical protein
MQDAFARLGLDTDYGGPHSNGVTHMALLGFVDGSYIELISALEPGRKDDTFWGEHIVGNGGPCAWAVQVADVAAEAKRVAALGITVTGPAYYQRQRPDGQLVEWDLAFLGDKGAGATLPFIIKDITPREVRVRPSASVSNGLLGGIAKVVLGVADLAAAIQLFAQVYDWSSPEISEVPHFGVKLAHFPGTPVIVATPLSQNSWLWVRLQRFGDSPCAYLIGTNNFSQVRQTFQLIENDSWFGHHLAWFEPTQLNGARLGVIESNG